LQMRKKEKEKRKTEKYFIIKILIVF